MALGGRRRAPHAREHVSQPVDMDELPVLRKELHRKALVLRPSLPALLVELDVREAKHGETIEQGSCSVPVEHELLLGDQGLRREDLPNVLVIERAESLARERDRAGNVTASGSAVDAPAVERMQGARVDDRSGRIAESCAELLGGHALPPRFSSGRLETIKSEVISQAVGAPSSCVRISSSRSRRSRSCSRPSG